MKLWIVVCCSLVACGGSAEMGAGDAGDELADAAVDSGCVADGGGCDGMCTGEAGAVDQCLSDYYACLAPVARCQGKAEWSCVLSCHSWYYYCLGGCTDQACRDACLMSDGECTTMTCSAR